MKTSARQFVKITLILWLFLFLLGALLVHQPRVALLPLLGLYPGDAASGGSDYNPTLMYAWAVVMFAVFSALAFFAVRRKSTAAGIALLAIFLISTGVSCARVVETLRQLR